MAERTGVIVSFNPSNQQGTIKPDDGGPEVKFFRKVVTSKEIVPTAGAKVSFEAPAARKTKDGKKLIQDPATSVTVTEQIAIPSGSFVHQSLDKEQSKTASNLREIVKQSYEPSDKFFAECDYDTNIPQFARPFAKAPQQTANIGLLLDKFVGIGYKRDSKGNFELDRQGDKKPLGLGKEWLDKAFVPFYLENMELNSPMFANFYARWTNFLETQKAIPKQMATSWRAAIHLGRTTVLENATIALHHTYGFPYIPGQSIKGLAHAYAEMVAYPEDPETVQRLFGQVISEEQTTRIKKQYEQKEISKEYKEKLLKMQQGSVVFFDAIPTQLPYLEVDILNPHFPDWYGDSSGRKVPSDNQSPIPVNFLTVAPDSPFLFAVAPVARLSSDKTGQQDAQIVLDLLVAALQTLGIGAKTAAGYGQFVESK